MSAAPVRRWTEGTVTEVDGGNGYGGDGGNGFSQTEERRKRRLTEH